MPILTTLGLLGGAVAGGGFSAAYAWLTAPEVRLNTEKLRWLDGVELEWTSTEEREVIATDALHSLEDMRGRPLLKEEREAVEEAARASALFSETLEEEGEEADRQHRMCAALLCPRKSGRKARTHHNARSKAFVRHWVARTRLKFPLRADRPSDRAAMATWLHKEMTARGIRPTHQEAAIHLVVQFALLPSQAELMAREMADEARPRTNGSRLLFDIRKRWRNMFSASTEVMYGAWDTTTLE